MAKRADRTGSLYQLPTGHWRAQVTIGDKRLSHTARTKKEVDAWVRKTTQQVEKGLQYDAAHTTTADYLTRWLTSVKGSLRPSTFDHYKVMVDKYLIPAFGMILIKDLAADRVQFVYDEWTRTGVGAPTMHKAHGVLHQALGRAVQTGLVYRNVAELVTPAKMPQKEMAFWSAEQANRFLATARDDRYYALFYLALVTGARQMELLGLRWEDLDWSRGTIHICRQLTRKGSGFAPLKTKAGNRTLDLGAGTLEVLHAHYEHQQIERQIAGNAWKEYGLIFTSLVGTGSDHKNVVVRHFKPLIKAAGVPAIRFHDLRHSAVAIMLSSGEPIFTVSKWIGHARASITSDIYGHLVAGATAGMGTRMDAMIAPVKVDFLPVAPALHRKEG